MKNQMKSVWFLLGLILVIIHLTPNLISIGNSAELALLWDPNDEADLDGYTLYQSTDSAGPPYDLIDDISLDELADQDNPEAVVTQLEVGKKYYFLVTAYDKVGNESQFSNQICLKIENSSIIDCTPASDSGRGGGGSAGGCFVSTVACGFRW